MKVLIMIVMVLFATQVTAQSQLERDIQRQTDNLHMQPNLQRDEYQREMRKQTRELERQTELMEQQNRFIVNPTRKQRKQQKATNNYYDPQ